MSYELMSDEQILAALGKQFETLRLHKKIPDADIRAKGGVTKDAIDRFRNNRGNITLINLIRILRGLGELERLEKLLNVHARYSPTQKESKQVKRISRRVSTDKTDFKWDDEQ